MYQSIDWQRPSTIPRTPFTNITIKDMDGELHNLTTDRHGRIPIADHEIKGWIPNNEQ